jgi:hypothetical protein
MLEDSRRLHINSPAACCKTPDPLFCSVRLAANLSTKKKLIASLDARRIIIGMKVYRDGDWQDHREGQ